MNQPMSGWSPRSPAIARRLDHGRVEVGLQRRYGTGWTERQTPAAPFLTRNWIAMQTCWLAKRTRNTPKLSRSIGPDSIPTASRGDAQRECDQTHMRSESPVDSTGIEAPLKPVSRYEDYATGVYESGYCMSYQFALHRPTERPTESARRHKSEGGMILRPNAQVELFIVTLAVLFFPNPSQRRSGRMKPTRWSSGWVGSGSRSFLGQ